MADNVTNQVLLEHLEAIQAKLAAMNGRMNELQADVRGIKSHMVGFMHSEISHDGTNAAMQERLGRIRAVPRATRLSRLHPPRGAAGGSPITAT